ncbi:hypothetical protein CC85DRAFT_285573 [Cutaneotrichosporon oleaginosum]|uniref:Autophagy protein 5 n=1 Tax=Cutaneotrichosporon oleaginosum TaxID=879819 RepID=A0A0J1B3V3_9TREE|nr:uncharacterized protein CC85DRAFT_285573 [Cutaneotrichosporon oleaginosum]KLT42329.1 hypothetical protein CC85DRAFT_285573 [Cutaneotrichosporon oleaginosum]TXT04149.1 hypothetical protein COLE_07846 [Cutaneotrichosporon oleaginosum]
MSGAVQTSTNLFRQLAWSATVPLEIRLANATGPVDRYFMHAPRYTYLALLLPTIREHLVELALDDDALASTSEAEWWFQLDATDSPFAGDVVRWHWPLDLVDLSAAMLRGLPPSQSLNTRTSPPSLSPPSPVSEPLKLILHLKGAPADKLVVPPSLDAIKTYFVSQVKEADFVRWGNTKRVTGLRRADFEAGWDGVVAGDYDLHARMAGRIVPLPIPNTPPTSPQPDAKTDSAYTARSLPIRVYLPDGAPPIQCPVAPLTDGKPTTLLQMLRTMLPLLFEDGNALAQPIAQGILLPPDADVAWLAACMAGADGWLRIGIRLVGE